MPIEGWSRLEPRPRSADFARALAAAVHDPAWLLGRQWQLGELRGEDAGTPVVARIELDAARVTRYQPRPGGSDTSAREYDPAGAPLEAMVERERVRTDGPDYRAAAEAGQHWLRILDAAALPFGADYLRAHPLRLADEAILAALDPGSRRFLRLVAGRVPDGGEIEAELRAAVASDPPALPVDPDVSGHEEAFLRAARAFLAWWDEMFSEPAAGERAWIPERLDYRFAVSAPFEGGEQVLVADAYHGGHLDWHAFDAARGVTLGAGTASTGPVVHAVVPSPVDFPGMPASRFWEMEDDRVALGTLPAGPEDLARLLLVEFALVSGDDWFVIPVEVEVGTVLRVRSLTVRDTFGIEASVRTPTTAGWGMFHLSETGSGPASPGPVYFVPPVVGPSGEGPPIEDVLLVRDEMANMAWAIERKVLGAAGRAIDRHEAFLDRRRRAEEANPPAAGLAAAVPRYRLATSVPDHWIPLVPVRDGVAVRAMNLQRGAMLDPATGRGIPPVGRILEPGKRLRIAEEEVPRAGARVTRAFQLARGCDGSTVLWLGRRVRPGRGEGSSGLRFDVIDDQR